jgi:CubicO group peptidase (beta-lactamase class C family)
MKEFIGATLTWMKRLALVAVSLLLLAGCSHDTKASGDPKEQTDAVFDGIGEAEPGCAVAVQGDGKLLYSAAYGVADVDKGTKITPTTRFELASVSKQFTAAAVYLLADEGKVRLDDDIHVSVPELPDYGATVTIDQLIHHTSGVPDYVETLSNRHADTDVTTMAEALDVLRSRKRLEFRPGSKYEYSNSGYLLLGLVVTRASGMSYRQFLEQRIFQPLGMDRSLVRDRHDEEIADSAIGYDKSKKGKFVTDVSNWEQVGDGGVQSTAEDMAKWLGNLSTWTVGGDALHRAMFATGKLTRGDNTDYGGGLEIDRSNGLEVSHTGSWAGYRSALDAYPDNTVGVAVLCNRDDADAGDKDYAGDTLTIWYDAVSR